MIEQIVKFNNALLGAPSCVLVVAGCLVIGYALRFAKWFPNEGIPLAVILAGAILNVLMTSPSDGTLVVVWATRTMIIGAILGAVAWLAHNRVLAKFEDKIPFLKGLLSNEQTDQGTPATVPPAVAGTSTEKQTPSTTAKP